MFTRVLSAAAASPRARRLVEGVPVTRRVVDRFVAGETVADAVRTTGALADDGRAVTIDVLGEDVTDLAGARRNRDTYLELAADLARAGAAPGTDLSLKLTALGASIGAAVGGTGHTPALDHAAEICAAAREHGFTVTLDMEDHTTTDATLLAAEKLRAEYPWLGTVLQSNLRRTAGDLEALRDARARIRLVKGAYREPASVAYQSKAEVDVAYTRDLTALFGSTCYPMVGTHDPAMLRHAADTARRAGRDDGAWETQMLYGVRTDLQAQAVSAGRRVRVYVPVGTDWYGYFMRRLAERPANLAFFLRALAHR